MIDHGEGPGVSCRLFHLLAVGRGIVIDRMLMSDVE